MLKGKHIILGVTGSIAAYKAATLTRLLVKEGASVKVVMTPLAKEFITPLTIVRLWSIFITRKMGIGTLMLIWGCGLICI